MQNNISMYLYNLHPQLDSLKFPSKFFGSAGQKKFKWNERNIEDVQMTRGEVMP